MKTTPSQNLKASCPRGCCLRWLVGQYSKAKQWQLQMEKRKCWNLKRALGAYFKAGIAKTGLFCSSLWSSDCCYNVHSVNSHCPYTVDISCLSICISLFLFPCSSFKQLGRTWTWTSRMSSPTSRGFEPLPQLLDYLPPLSWLMDHVL